MNKTQFCYWLKGYLTRSCGDCEIKEEQLQEIKSQLELAINEQTSQYTHKSTSPEGHLAAGTGIVPFDWSKLFITPPYNPNIRITNCPLTWHNGGQTWGLSPFIQGI